MCVGCSGAEGDLEKNAKLWYQEVDPSLLTLFWNPSRFNSSDSDPTKAAIDNMYKIMSVKAGEASKELEQEVRRVKWDELCFVMAELENKFGWGQVEGTEVYSYNGGGSGMVLGEYLVSAIRLGLTSFGFLGEGYRTWDKKGYSER